MSDLPLVSIIVPCYNHIAFVRDCIQSILDQEYPNKEIILIDDGSSDGTTDIVLGFSKHENVQAICRKNKGLANTLNKGIERSKGKYLILFASDDVMIKGRITRQVRWMEKNAGYAVCSGKLIGIDEHGNTSNHRNTPFKSGYIFESLLFNKIYIMAPTAMIRRSVLDDIGLYDPTIGFEDFDMWCRIAQKYPFGFIDEFFAYYRTHQTNIHKNGPLMLKEKQKTLQKLRGHPLYKRALLYFFSNGFFILSEHTKHKKEALKYLCKTLPHINYLVIKGTIKLFVLWK